jgi:3-phenylpropionate/trans-cinnamate dioxygenase ferredoxin reductase subunit
MFGLFKSAQPKTVHIEGLSAPLQVNPKETILQAALRQGVRFPHSCRVGGCASCKCQLKSGKVKELTESAYVLSDQELADGYVLACQAVPKTDLAIRVDNLGSGPTHPVIRSAGVITQVQRYTHDIVELVVTLDEPMAYAAGQYALLSVPGLIEEPRSYSFASAPLQGGNRTLHFFVRAVPGGLMSNWAQQHNRIGASVRVEGPFGDFYLRESAQPILCIAGGSGLAPIKALLEDALAFKCPRPVTFLFGARTQRDLYCLDEIQTLAREWAGDFRFVPVLSEEPADSDWSGARGLVTDHIDAHLQPHSQIYMCGPPAMLDAAEAQLRTRDIPAEEIFSDKFLDKSALAKSA